MHRVVAGMLLIGIVVGNAYAAAPRLYAQPSYQSPVRADPDDLLLVPGFGFTASDVVVYEAVPNTTDVPEAPVGLPSESTASRGFLEVVSTKNIPYSLTVRLPQAMERDRSYAIWVRNTAGEWSDGILINDARPLWVTPAYVHSTVSVARLPRSIKVVGRNLRPAPGQRTMVRLSGPEDVTLMALADRDPAAVLADYAAVANLPARLAEGRYSVSVSRDGTSWEPLAGQMLEVLPDPAQLPEFLVSEHGTCEADDGRDDATCIVSAIAAAAGAGGGSVVFEQGDWDLFYPRAAGVAEDGIIVPPGVSLTATAGAAPRIVRRESWTPPAFTLQGTNTVRDLVFCDASLYEHDSTGRAILQLGKAAHRADRADMLDPKRVDDVVITGNVFARPYIAIGSGGLPISRLFVTNNEFGAYHTSLWPGGDRSNTDYKFRIDDSVIVGNVFKPGSYLDESARQGAIASQLGASHRVDFSSNIADGAATDHLYAETDARGWRAAFFWHLNGSGEKLLVSQNVVTCPGDKIGDGEAIVLDNNGNTFALPDAQRVVEATADTVGVSGPLQSFQNDRSVDIADYYVGHWLQVAEGRGVGQVRRIVGYTLDSARARIVFRVAPEWDVVPLPGQTRVSVGRQFWQVYTVDNIVDQREPRCRKSNRSGPKGGAIAYWAQTADSVIAGNVQNDTDGIALQQSYNAVDPACPACVSATSYQYFVEIRQNRIVGEYDARSDCSQSGITLSYAAAETPSLPPPVASYGVSVSNNSIARAHGLRGAAITVPLTWTAGPPPHDWKLVSNLLIHHNSIADVTGPHSRSVCDLANVTRAGIGISDSKLVWRSVLYANSCVNVDRPLVDAGAETVVVCAARADTCECSR